MDITLHKPSTLEDAVRLKAEDPDAMFLAGGQTLVAMMNADLAEPSALITLDGVPELKGIECNRDGEVRIGAMVRHGDVASSDQLVNAHMVLKSAAKVIAHPAIRNLGTIGGAASFGDPNSDFPPALVAADARFSIGGPKRTREVAAGDFFLDYMTTDLEEDELLTAIILPPVPDRSRGHYEKFSRVEGDYATASVAVTLSLDQDAAVDCLRIVVGASGATPVRVPNAEKYLQENGLGKDVVVKAAEQILSECDLLDDVRGSSDYRRLLIPGLIQKAISTVNGSRAES